MRLIGSCVGMSGSEIALMTDAAREIGYRTFMKRVGKEASRLFEALGYAQSSRNGLTVKKDYSISFHKSKYRGRKCYYLRHSSIEYVFQE